jgi:hypothetical protein
MCAMPTTRVENTERRDQHLDEPQEDVRNERDVAGDRRRDLLVRVLDVDHVPDDDAEDHGAEDDASGRELSLHPA